MVRHHNMHYRIMDTIAIDTASVLRSSQHSRILRNKLYVLVMRNQQYCCLIVVIQLQVYKVLFFLCTSSFCIHQTFKDSSHQLLLPCHTKSSFQAHLRHQISLTPTCVSDLVVQLHVVSQASLPSFYQCFFSKSIPFLRIFCIHQVFIYIKHSRILHINFYILVIQSHHFKHTCTIRYHSCRRCSYMQFRKLHVVTCSFASQSLPSFYHRFFSQAHPLFGKHFGCRFMTTSRCVVYRKASYLTMCQYSPYPCNPQPVKGI